MVAFRTSGESNHATVNMIVGSGGKWISKAKVQISLKKRNFLQYFRDNFSILLDGIWPLIVWWYYSSARKIQKVRKKPILPDSEKGQKDKTVSQCGLIY